MSILRALEHSILLETFSDERLIDHRGYDDAGIRLNENRRKVLTKLFDGFCFVPVGDIRAIRSSPSIPFTGIIVTYY